MIECDVEKKFGLTNNETTSVAQTKEEKREDIRLNRLAKQAKSYLDSHSSGNSDTASMMSGKSLSSFQNSVMSTGLGKKLVPKVMKK